MQISGSSVLALTRFYNVLDTNSGSLGTGWRHSFEISLDIKEDEVLLLLPDGKKFTYSKKKDGTFSVGQTRDRLVKEQGEYIFRKSNGNSFHFDEKGNCLCYV